MADGLDGIMNEVFTGDAPEAAPVETAVQDSAPAAEATAPLADAGAQDGEGLFRWDEVPEQLLPQAKGFQASYTRRMQELAEQRKALETQGQRYQQYEQLERLMNEDPARAAAWLKWQAEQAEQIAGGVQAGVPETDPLSLIEPQTDVEQQLLAQVRSLADQQRQFSQWHQQQVAQQQRAQLDSEFAAIGRKVGRELPLEEQHAIAAFAVQHNIPNVELAYKAMKFDEAVEAARRAGVDQGATVLTQKAAMGPAPAPAADRAGRVVEQPKGLDALTAAVATELGI